MQSECLVLESKFELQILKPVTVKLGSWTWFLQYWLNHLMCFYWIVLFPVVCTVRYIHVLCMFLHTVKALADVWLNYGLLSLSQVKLELKNVTTVCSCDLSVSLTEGKCLLQCICMTVSFFDCLQFRP